MTGRRRQLPLLMRVGLSVAWGLLGALILCGSLVVACAGSDRGELDAQPPAGDQAGWPVPLVELAAAARDRFGVPVMSVASAGDLPGTTVIVDVRTPREIAVSVIPGAVVLSDGLARDAFRRAGHDGPVLVYCTAGWRSAQFTAELVADGITAFNLEGGVCAWAAAGKQLVDPHGQATRRIHAFSADFADCVPATYEAVTSP